MADAENQEGRSGTGDKKPVTLITGATKGIGLGFARAFATRGHDLFLVARSKDDLNATSEILADEFGVDIKTIDVDISTAAGCAAVERAVRKKGCFVEYLVNNAGYGLAGTFDRIDHEQTLNMLDLNVRALTDLTARFLPEMIAQDRGGVLNVSSLAGLTPGPYQATYYATKAYVNSLTRALGWETVRTRVKFSVLACGPVATEFHSRMGADTAYYVKLLGLQDAEEVARIATEKFFDGRRVIIPGFLNKLSAISMKFTPHLLLVPAVAWLLKLRGPAARADGRHAKADESGAVANWEHGLTYRPEIIVRPEMIDDVVRVVTDAQTYPSPVRAVGTLHSPARCSADDRGTMLDMTGMSRILEIGDDFVTAEAGAAYIDVAEALAAQGKQFHVNTEIGNVTLGAMACAATKDSSLIGSSRFGQISSFVTSVKLVKPDGSVAVYTQDEHAQEMRLLRSSYGLLGVIVEVTLKVQPITAVFAEHRIYSLDQFRAAVPELVEQEFALMMYLFPFADRVVVELRREVPGETPTSSGRWWLRNAFWRKLGPMLMLFAKRISPNGAIENALIRALHRIMRRGMSWLVRGKRTRADAQIIRYPDDPGPNKYVFSMWSFDEAGYFDTLEAYFAFCHDYAERTGYRCDLPAVGYRIFKDRNSLLSYSHNGTVLSIDPADTGGEGWDEFLQAFNDFCSKNGGYPMLNQTKHLTAAQVRKAFGKRLDKFARARSVRDPEDRLLSTYFADFLNGADAALATQDSASTDDVQK